MRVLVTGSSSLLGGALARRLFERGDRVRVMQRRPSGLGFTETLGSVEAPDDVARAVDDVDAVVHLAARVAVVGRPESFRTTNVEGTSNLLQAARRAGVSRFVYVSSPSVAHPGVSICGADAQPADPQAARGNYARSKAEAEILALAANQAGFAVVAIRPHLVWGPGDSQLVGRIVDQARRGRLALVGSGMSLIDTTYLDNAVEALVAALDRADRLGGRALVVSNGEPRTVAELFTRIVAAAGVPPPTMRIPVPLAKCAGAILDRWWTWRGREDDPPMTRFLAEQLSTAHWFDQRETRGALGWRPAVSLDEGFERLRRWYSG